MINNEYEKLTYRVETSTPASNKGIKMAAENGVPTVRSTAPIPSGPRSGREAGSEKNEYAIGQAAMTYIILEPGLRKMLDSNQ